MSQEMAKAVDQLFGQDPQDEVSGSVNKGISFVKSRSEAVGFPKGWYREELVKSGVGVMNPGQKIIHYYSPDGRKFRTKAELARFFGVRVDLSNFDFKTGRIHSSYTSSGLNKKSQQQGKIGAALKNGSASLSTVTLQKFLEPPVRQCTCILNQKVRSIETCGPNERKDAKDIARAGERARTSKPKPIQVFWAKRLDGITAVDADSDRKLTPQLPRGFKAASGIVSDSAALISLASAMYNASTPGHTAGPDELAPLGQPEKIKSNPGAYVHPHQPLISATRVTASLIEEQELQVQRLRSDLAKILGRQQKERG